MALPRVIRRLTPRQIDEDFQVGEDRDGLLVVNPFRNDPSSLLGE